MHFKIVSTCSILAAAALSLANTQAANAKEPELQERRLAVNLVRAVNTAEMAYRDHSGGLFTGWAELSATTELNNLLTRLSRGEPKLKNANLSSPDAILPGWRLRLTVSEDHKSYTVMVVSTVDQCSYAVMSDQEGLIREGSAIGCSSSKSGAAKTEPGERQ